MQVRVSGYEERVWPVGGCGRILWCSGRKNGPLLPQSRGGCNRNGTVLFSLPRSWLTWHIPVKATRGFAICGQAGNPVCIETDTPDIRD